MAWIITPAELQRWVNRGFLPPPTPASGGDGAECIHCDRTIPGGHAWCRDCRAWLACETDDEPPKWHPQNCTCLACALRRSQFAEVQANAERNAAWALEDAAWLSTGTAA